MDLKNLKEKFRNILKLNKQHHTLEEKLKENVGVVFDEIQEELKKYNYHFCPHFPYEKLTIHIYKGTIGDSPHLYLEDFEIVYVSDNFEKDLLKIIKDFCAKGKNECGY